MLWPWSAMLEGRPKTYRDEAGAAPLACLLNGVRPRRSPARPHDGRTPNAAQSAAEIGYYRVRDPGEVAASVPPLGAEPRMIRRTNSHEHGLVRLVAGVAAALAVARV